jgi:hypothetical protein
MKNKKHYTTLSYLCLNVSDWFKNSNMLWNYFHLCDVFPLNVSLIYTIYIFDKLLLLYYISFSNYNLPNFNKPIFNPITDHLAIT